MRRRTDASVDRLAKLLEDAADGAPPGVAAALRREAGYGRAAAEAHVSQARAELRGAGALPADDAAGE